MINLVKEVLGGLNRDLNPGPPAPEAGIIPLDHWATLVKFDHQGSSSKIMILIKEAHGNLTSSPFCTGDLSSKERMQSFIHKKLIEFWGLWLFQVPHLAALFAVFVDFVHSARFHKYPGFVYAYTLTLVPCIPATLCSLTHRLQRRLRRSVILDFEVDRQLM